MLCRSDNALDSSDSNIRYQSVEEHIPWLEAVRQLGGEAIRVDCRSSGDYEEQKNYAVDGLSQLSDVARPFGMNILLENHGGFSGNGKWVADVMKRVNSQLQHASGFPNFTDYDPYLGVKEMMPFAKVVPSPVVPRQ